MLQLAAWSHLLHTDQQVQASEQEHEHECAAHVKVIQGPVVQLVQQNAPCLVDDASKVYPQLCRCAGLREAATCGLGRSRSGTWDAGGHIEPCTRHIAAH